MWVLMLAPGVLDAEKDNISRVLVTPRTERFSRRRVSEILRLAEDGGI